MYINMDPILMILKTKLAEANTCLIAGSIYIDGHDFEEMITISAKANIISVAYRCLDTLK